MREQKNLAISSDCLFFIILLIPHFFRFPELNYTAFPHGVWSWATAIVPPPTASLPDPSKLFVTAILAFLFIGYSLSHMLCQDNPALNQRLHRLKIAIILSAFVLVIYIPMLHEISLRYVLGPETHAHDGLIQTEEAIKKTLQGRNVYTETFYGTALEKSNFSAPQRWRRLGMEGNPALEGCLYLPLLFIIPLPFYLIATKTIGWFDLRIVLVIFYFAFLWLAYKIPAKSEKKIIALQFAALNPFMATFLITGRNDVLPMAMLFASFLLVKRNTMWAQVFLALACLTKQYVWITVPFFGLFLIRKESAKNLFKTTLEALRALLPFGIIFIAGMLPYLIWNPKAFLQRILLQGNAFPIKGIGAYGFGTWVLFFGWAKDSAASFPFLALQLPFTLIVLFLCLKRQLRNNTLSQVIAGGALTLLVFFYFSRFFHDNYFGAVIMLLAMAFCVQDTDMGDRGDGCLNK